MLTFERLREANLSRAISHQGGIHTWDTADWLVEFMGEAGELCNVVKKLKRLNDGIDKDHLVREKIIQNIKEELADAMICLDLVASSLGLKIEEVVPPKFNATSKKWEVDERL